MTRFPTTALNEPTDWVRGEMPERWGGWLRREVHAVNPLLSPIHADWRNMPPVYIQAGDAEILYDMICEFAARTQAQGADVTLDVWP